MLASIKKILKIEVKKNEKSQSAFYILRMIKVVFEDIVFWKSRWLSITFLSLLNVFFFVIAHIQLNLVEIILYISITCLLFDGFETWLKFKHRNTCLKHLSNYDSKKLDTLIAHLNNWIYRKWIGFSNLRETNHTKAFLLMNVIMTTALMIGKCCSGYVITYLLCVFVCILNKIAPPLLKFVSKIQQNADSDVEIEGLVPDVSDVDIRLLSIEPEANQVYDDRQSLDYWKPDDLPLEESSDSSDHSSTLVKNMAIEKLHNFDKDVETSESSEDEYTPIIDHHERLQSTVEFIEPTSSWTSAATNTLWNMTGNVMNMIYTKNDATKKKRVESMDSSDGFEMVDKNDLL